ncbi:hypothetical protein QFZ63_000048 [Streptomyces sp. B3I7]|nr:hypothetical protein [Streptomyces sp. B3I7]
MDSQAVECCIRDRARASRAADPVLPGPWPARLRGGKAALPGVLKSPPLLAQLLLLRSLRLRLAGALPNRLLPQALIGLGLLVLIKRGGYVLSGYAGASKGVIKAGLFFRGAHATPPVVRPGMR